MTLIIKKLILTFLIFTSINNLFAIEKDRFKSKNKTYEEHPLEKIIVDKNYHTRSSSIKNNTKNEQDTNSLIINRDFSYIKSKARIKENILEFNRIIYQGKDYLVILPVHTLLANKSLKSNYKYLHLMKYYLPIIIGSLFIGTSASFPIISFVNILEMKNDLNIYKIINDKLNNNTFNIINANDFREQIINFYNDPYNYNIKEGFYQLSIMTSLLFSAVTYNLICFYMNFYQLKQYQNLRQQNSFLCKIFKIITSVSLSSISLVGYYSLIDNSLQTLNNIIKSQDLRTEDHILKYAGVGVCGLSVFIYSNISCIPVMNLFVETANNFIKLLMGKDFNFRDLEMSNVLHYLLDSKEIKNPSKRFVHNLICGDFDREDNLDLCKSMQLLNLNLNESINLSGIINNITITNLKNTNYSFNEGAPKKDFIKGSVKILSLVGFSYVIFELIRNLYVSNLIVKEMANAGFTFDANEYKFNISIPIDNTSQLNYSEINNPLLINSIANDTVIINTLDVSYLNKIIDNIDGIGIIGLGIQISTFTAAGVIHVIFDSIEKIQTIIEHKGNYYRGLTPLLAAISSSILPLITSYYFISFYDGIKEITQYSEYAQRCLGRDTSVLGIDNINTKFILLNIFSTISLLQTYKSLLPITTAFFLGANKFLATIRNLFTKD